MTNYRKHLSEPWFSLVKLNMKVAEGRLKKAPFNEMKVGDTVTFYNSDFNHRETTVKVTGIREYPDFESYLRRETLRRSLPGFTTISDGLSVYRKYFTEEQERELGVIVICFD
jgi:ASC-1-like (ASCH) protein